MKSELRELQKKLDAKNESDSSKTTNLTYTLNNFKNSSGIDSSNNKSNIIITGIKHKRNKRAKIINELNKRNKNSLV